MSNEDESVFHEANKIHVFESDYTGEIEYVSVEDLYQAFKKRMTQELSLGKSTSNYSCVNTTGGLKGRFDR